MTKEELKKMVEQLTDEEKAILCEMIEHLIQNRPLADTRLAQDDQ